MRLLHRAHGIKDRGIRRERGLQAVRHYLQIKNVAVRL
jgi:acyl-CoA reductase-like NAD-dependent aldehyde dehydrogenase